MTLLAFFFFFDYCLGKRYALKSVIAFFVFRNSYVVKLVVKDIYTLFSHLTHQKESTL